MRKMKWEMGNRRGEKREIGNVKNEMRDEIGEVESEMRGEK